MKKISVIVPMYFEEDVVFECYTRLKSILNTIKNYTYEIIFVDDGSKDKTLNILKEISSTDFNVKVISFSRNFGHQCAVTAGLQYTTGDAVIILDADLQDPPELIPNMLLKWEEGYDVIYGKRKIREGESPFKLLSAKLFYQTLNKLSDTEIPKDTGDFRLVDRKVIDVINNLPEHNKFLRGLFSWVGYNQYAYEYERKERFAGKTKYSLDKMIKLATDGIIGFSKKPLKITIYLSIILMFLSIILFIYILYNIFTKTNLIYLWNLITINLLLFISSIILLAINIQSQYISRIYDEVIKRPQYIIKEKINI